SSSQVWASLLGVITLSIRNHDFSVEQDKHNQQKTRQNHHANRLNGELFTDIFANVLIHQAWVLRTLCIERLYVD
ncbi:hypothetical protein, partial [Enterococcus faecium]|uniref:hypothetical protein n=1 Tax=Enterococcus faecium TaxID=1352 RepID=UPI003F44111E